MEVAVLTAGILALFLGLGYPASRLLFPQLDRDRAGRRSPPASLLLAPMTGLGLFAIYTGAFFAARKPMTAAFPAFWLFLGLVWGVFLLVVRRRRAARPAMPPPGRWLPGAVPLVGGLVVVLGMALAPFLQNRDLVYWHYAGSDGYMYMRIAEHVAAQGSGVIPELGPYDGASGFLAEVMRNFQTGFVQDKPAVMSSLGALSVLFGRLPHELFSPASCAALAMLYLSLFVFGQQLLRLPGWAAASFAGFAASAPTIWMLYTHTFFGNLLALPFYVALLFLLRPFPAWGTALGFGLLSGAQMALFPDGTIALFGMFAAAVPYLTWTACRRRRLRRLVLSGGVACAATSLVVFMFGLRLWVTATGRLNAMFAGGPSHFTGSGGGAVSKFGGFKVLPTIDWSWPALNLNTIPPQPLQASERPYLFWLLAVLSGYVLVSAWRRRGVQLAWYLVAFGLLYLIGWAGFFKSDYELFRGLAVFSYLPLAAVCGLPWVLSGETATLRGRGLLGLGLAAVAPLLWHFAGVDQWHFRHGLNDHPADAQYTAGQLRDRAAIAALGRDRRIVAGSETPSFTAIANVMVLFSNSPLGLPACFHKFVFFHPQPPEAAYAAPLLLRNLQYPDITVVAPPAVKLYSGESFSVVSNDLNPFYDNDTFPQLHPYPVAFIGARNLPVARVLAAPTRIAFNNRAERLISLKLQLTGAGLPDQLGYAYDDGPGRQAPVSPDGYVVLPSPAPLARGVHGIRLEAPPPHPVEVSALWLQETRPEGTDEWQRVRARALPPRLGQLDVFRHMTPQPVLVYSQYGAALFADFVSCHPETHLYFQVPAGARRLRTHVQLNAEAYENVPESQASDGVQLELALLTADARREVVYSRLVDPSRNPADRGPVPVDVHFTAPPGAELELSIGPGPKGNPARDWAAIGPLRIE